MFGIWMVNKMYVVLGLMESERTRMLVCGGRSHRVGVDKLRWRTPSLVSWHTAVERDRADKQQMIRIF